MKRVNVLLKYTRTNGTRHLNISSSLNNKTQVENRNSNASATWDPIYYFPHIVMARLLNRVKLYQTFISVTGIPTSIYLYSIDLAEFSTVEYISAYGIVASIMLYALTSYFKRLIGIIAVSEDENLVKISHLTFWGNRNDIVVPIEDIIPLSDGDSNPHDLYVDLKRFSTNDVLYFTLKYGKILDKVKFEKVFGSLETFGFK